MCYRRLTDHDVVAAPARESLHVDGLEAQAARLAAAVARRWGRVAAQLQVLGVEVLGQAGDPIRPEPGIVILLGLARRTANKSRRYHYFTLMAENMNPRLIPMVSRKTRSFL